ncbi:hypothetical protein [Nakamurella sp.]|uniref:hypothetical protein n=1 Tax=Nakamurella sp. TaxID=1869182 RepID=UPI003784BCAA
MRFAVERSAVRVDGLRYLRNYGLGMALVAAGVTLLSFTLALGAPGFVVVSSTLCLAGYLGAVGSAIRRTWLSRQWRPAVALGWTVAITALTAAVRLPLGGAHLGGPADWTFAAYGYIAVIMLAGQRLRYTVGALTANLVIGLPALLGALDVDRALLLSLVQTSIGVTIFPLAAALFYPRLAVVARIAQEQVQARQELLSGEARAVRLAQDRAARTAAIASTVVPLLAALADGSADPQDPAVQRAARIESARLRRIFAEADDADQPLLHEIRASMAAAERSGVAAVLEVRGPVPALSVPVRRHLLDGPMSLLAAAGSRARVVLTASAGAVSVSVVADSADFRPPGDAPGISTTTVTTGATTWTQSCWAAEP